ncbi:MAG: alpha/beta hydrolase [Rhodobacteraceae bacterium]|nr:alpha/beta hydrolase [Paracoccaceae bacterium]
MIWIPPLLILLGFFLALPWLAEGRRPLPDLKRAPGKIAQLPGGDTHYRWYGPVRGPVIVAVHGLSTPSPVWDGITDGLTQLGYRVLVYDLYGRGFSAPFATGGPFAAAKQDSAHFLSQLEELIADQGLDDGITILGFSMGGAIATALAAARPELVDQVILIAPCGMAQLDETAAQRFARKVPFLGDWLHLAMEPLKITTAQRRTQLSGPPGFAEGQRIAQKQRGYFPALLASRRGIIQELMEQEHRQISKTGQELAAVWAADDAVVPVSGLGQLSQWNRAARQEMVEGAGHHLLITHPAQTLEALHRALRIDEA